jgi:hypothetical protein
MSALSVMIFLRRLWKIVAVNNRRDVRTSR